MDAYDISQSIKDKWQHYVLNGVDSGSVSKKLNDVFVYVEIDGSLKKVYNVTEQDNKVILKIE